MRPDLVTEAPDEAYPHFELVFDPSRIQQLGEVELARALPASSKGKGSADGAFFSDAGDPSRPRSVGAEAAANAGRRLVRRGVPDQASEAFEPGFRSRPGQAGPGRGIPVLGDDAQGMSPERTRASRLFSGARSGL